MRRTIDHLKQKQSLPLKAKMLLTKVRMEEFELDHRSIHIKPTNPKRDAILKELTGYGICDIDYPGCNVIISSFAEDSEELLERWQEYGCNEPNVCRPLSIWTEKDVEEYYATHKRGTKDSTGTTP